MTTPIDIRADHLRIVHDVLARHLPDGVRVWVFGSRATWATKDSSDLDLALEGDTQVPARSLAALESAFEDSDLPYAVDVVDVNRIGRRFRRIVEQQRVRLPGSDGRRSADRRNGPRSRWPDTWCGKTIEDIAASSPNAVVGGPFGSNLVSRDYVRGGVPVIRGQNMGARWVTGDFVFVTPEKAASLKANLARPGDVVLTQRGTLGQVSIVPSALPRCLVSQSQMKVTVDREVADSQFLYYVLSSAEQQAYVRQNAIQTGVPHTNLEILRSTPIPVPPLTEQRAIARVLGTLDDKIELNWRMNATLEAMARALFRSWFVDFDPVRAKLDVRDTELPKGVHDLFPDRLVDSDMGQIPEGWIVKTLGDLCHKPQYGYTASARSEPVGPRFLRITDINKESWVSWSRVPYCEATDDELSRYRLTKGDVLIARMADPGHGVLVEEDVEAVFASYLIRFRPVEDRNARLLQYWLKSDAYWNSVRGQAAGTTRVSLNARVLSLFPLVVPPDGVASTFAAVVGALRDRLTQSATEMQVLARLRDALLPKLVSGELRVRDAEKLVGAIA